jgi:hypothetical protein
MYPAPLILLLSLKRPKITSDFAGMDFTFSNDANVTVTGSKNANGTWLYSAPVAGYYGAPFSLATFTINIV